MAEWRQGGYDGIFYLGKEGTEEYGGYVVQVDEKPNPEKWFAYEYDAETRGTVWVGEAPTAEDAQKAVKAEFLCEIYRNNETGHCPYPGVVVRTTVYKGERLRTIVCGEHSRVLKGWESVRLEEYRTEYGLFPNDPIIGGRITPPLDLPPIREAALKAATVTERNMWIALNRVVRPLAELAYWRGHFARYPLDLNKRPCIDAHGQWKHAQEHAAGMYEVYMRENHGQENATLPNELLRLIEREAVEYLKSKKGGK
ncbi:hypothetical protein SEA_SUCCESS_84 [Streptomyces phage Success]|uniref:Uncharacterized protein n=1 Tax=Streptomyces phage Success TaxID=2999013 RepID=A0A9E8M7M7_9CAUD|nr:hypothetical protein QEH47_gp48 [Streptomyces phage Success]WAB08863.1 hypothetical protein SEA_SUCCESS_84 [Streptomyces phage Success]